MSDLKPATNSERYYFKLYWNEEQFSDSGKYVFCDELEGYTFVPYAGKLKDQQEYCENKETFEDARIYIIDSIADRLSKVPCNISEARQKIYLTEGNFNKYWRQISREIYKSAYKGNISDKAAQAAINGMVDLSLMENPSRTARIGNYYTIEYKGREIDLEKQRMISKKASALDDNKIRFVYSKSDNLVHDKTCWQVAKIEYWDFGASEKLPQDREICQYCRRKIYVRNAIQNDTKRFGWYMRFFENGRVSNKALESFLGSGEAKLHMVSVDELQVMYKEDTWLIRADGKGKYTLRHNNYVMINDHERYITSEFHKQKHYPPYLPGILLYIEGYDWHKHLETKNIEPKSTASLYENGQVVSETSAKMEPLESENAKTDALKNTLPKAMSARGIWDKFKTWVKQLFRGGK